MCTPVSVYVGRGLLPLYVEGVESRRASGTSDSSDESRRSAVTPSLHLLVSSFLNPSGAKLPPPESPGEERCRDVPGDTRASWIYACLGMTSPVMSDGAEMRWPLSTMHTSASLSIVNRDVGDREQEGLCAMHEARASNNRAASACLSSDHL